VLECFFAIPGIGTNGDGQAPCPIGVVAPNANSSDEEKWKEKLQRTHYDSQAQHDFVTTVSLSAPEVAGCIP
jgi:hypothetical protein